MAFGFLSGIGLGVLGSATLSGPPAITPESAARVADPPGVEVQVSFEGAGVDTEGCNVYRVRRVQEGQSLRVRTGLFWQSTTGEWTRHRPNDCVKPETEGKRSR